MGGLVGKQRQALALASSSESAEAATQ